MSLLPLILASTSPRRKQLLEQAGYECSVIPPDEGAESIGEIHLTPVELVAALATRKAANVVRKTDRGIILAADTVAECGGQILGKPRDRAHAAEILNALNGRVHAVHSGVCLWRVPGHQKSVRTETTILEMDRLTPTQIEDYLDSGLWKGKAGAFGYQDDLDWVTIQQGSASNVVGLPMELLRSMLENEVFQVKPD